MSKSTLHNFEKEMKKLKNNISKLENAHEVPLETLFSTSFMQRYTSFLSIYAFLKAGGFNAETNEEFEAIPEHELDTYVRANTKFNSWQDMLGEAGEQYMINLLDI